LIVFLKTSILVIFTFSQTVYENLMQQLTPAGQHTINDIANRYHLSKDAVLCMLIAVNNGGGRMAQFNISELGGSGQWMRGGMTMVGNMFNHGLKMTVDNLCNELANALSTTQIFPIIEAGTPGSNQWWPADLGSPFSSGSQNNIRYAIFPNRLATELNGAVTIYDTLDHNIRGVSQQQGGNTSLTFSSQYGTIGVNSLPIISGGGQSSGQKSPPPANFAEPASYQPAPSPPTPKQEVQQSKTASSKYPQQSSDEILALIEKLAQLKGAGVLSDSEYEAKKGELLARL
jgi:hypothetical protein